VDLGVDHISDRMVAVGVDASPESLAAARYAVHEASLRGLDLVLVHAFEPPSVSVPVEQAIFDAYRQGAETVVTEIAAQLVVPSHMRINSLVVEDLAAPLLLRVAKQVPLLAVGQDHISWTERLMFGRVASQVAQKSSCPVVVVPGSWQAPRTGLRHPVVVALDGDSLGSAVLQMAFERADALRTGLVALHAAPYGSGEREIASQAANLTELLAGWKQDYPGVAVDSLVVLGDEDANLLQWSKSAAVLVVERPHRHWWNPTANAVIRTVLRHTQCPLIIVPQQRS
jgi:nucleotide-binding universal stress UspA family protein